PPYGRLPPPRPSGGAQSGGSPIGTYICRHVSCSPLLSSETGPVLFNSYAFIFVFFPLTFAGFFLVARRSRPAAAAWLAAASLFFYGWWSVKAVPLLVASV